MHAISWEDYLRYGCPECGCDFAVAGNVSDGQTSWGICQECDTKFAILYHGAKKSSMKIGFGDGPMECPELEVHPRKGIPWHPYVFPDPRPIYAEYWKSREIGYDLSGFVKSKAAGERILEMVKEVLQNDSPKSWLDYREHEPLWIQFKFQKEEFDLELLDKMVRHNDDIITKDILRRTQEGGVAYERTRQISLPAREGSGYSQGSES